ncbi:MAG: hypothetical protein HN368_03525 [Spirochaetales bacterium]|jgi:hypothetical protein|nr:hypothetical protein [Spirochaetales bacterium]
MINLRNLGSKRELFVDPWLIDILEGSALHRLHEPIPRNIIFRTDAAWEGNRGGYSTIFEDNGLFRMYYFNHQSEIIEEPPGTFREELEPLRIAYAESNDGISWLKPELGLFEHNGSKKNNYVWMGVGPSHTGTHGFAPFKDTNSNAAPDEQYKALGTLYGQGAEPGLYSMYSPDGFHWQLSQESPVMTCGKFDSQNLAFWDTETRRYCSYVRNFHKGKQDNEVADNRDMGIRDIRVCYSDDFIKWSEPEMLTYTGSADEALYTNQVTPYYRAPHIKLGFPARYVERDWTKSIELLPGLENRKLQSAVSPRYGTVVTDTRFMASRDGSSFYKWPQVFLRPGPQLDGNWTYGDNYQCWGLIETPSDIEGAPPELSFIASENYRPGTPTVFRRYSLRVDGFASVWANTFGGVLVTKPLTFSGSELFINFSASASGRIRVGIEHPDGRAIDGFRLVDNVESIGDDLDRQVYWKGGRNPGEFAGSPVRLRFDIKDADLFALQFRSLPKGAING